MRIPRLPSIVTIAFAFGACSKPPDVSAQSLALDAPCACPAASKNTSRISFNDCGNVQQPNCSSEQCEYEMCGSDSHGSYCGCLWTRTDGSTYFSTSTTEYGCLHPGEGTATPYYGSGTYETHDCE
jgi:hypothetical protein